MDRNRYQAALQELFEQRLVFAGDTKGLLVVNPTYSSQIDSTNKWKVNALQAVARAFPIYPDQGAWYVTLHQMRDSSNSDSSTLAASMTPPLVSVLSYLGQVHLGHELQVAMAKKCLSASNFGLLPWKQYMLENAAKLAGNDPCFTAKLELRQYKVSRLEGQQNPGIVVQRPHRANLDRGANGQFGETIILQMNILLQRDAPFHVLKQHRDLFQPLPSEHEISPQERCVMRRADAILARACRNIKAKIDSCR